MKEVMMKIKWMVIIYTMIELFVSLDNKLVDVAYDLIKDAVYGKSSAMLWIYFVIVLILIGGVYLLYQHFCVKRWE